jgi:hypothetical protein
MGSTRCVSVVTMSLSIALLGCQQDIFIPKDPVVVPDPDPEPPDFGSWLAMDIAPDGERLVIGYYDREQGAVGFAIGTVGSEGVTWAHEQVDGYQDPSSGLDVGDRGKYCTMRVAPDGTVWMAYYDTGKKSLYYAHRTGGVFSWETGLVDAGSSGIPAAGEWSSMALDADGNPIISYYDVGEKTLKVARLAATQDDASEGYEWDVEEIHRGQPWVSTTEVDASGAPVQREASVGTYSRILIEDGVEYIAYYDEAQQRLGLMQGTAGAYTQSFVTEEGLNMGQWPSMLVDSGTLHIAYHDVDGQNLMVATRTASGWQQESPDQGDFVGADTEIVKRNGNIGVLYFDGQNNDMKYTDKSGTVWVSTTVGSEANAVGFHNEIVELNGDWWVGSYDFTNRTLFLDVLE